jgi:hypothetical protein
MNEIFTRAALAQQSLPDLHVLFRQAQAQLANCELGSHEHFAHAENLQNVRREIAIRANPALRP